MIQWKTWLILIIWAISTLFATNLFAQTALMEPEQVVQQFFNDYKRLNFRNILTYTTGPAHDLYKQVRDHQEVYSNVPESYMNMASYMQVSRILHSSTDVSEEGHEWAYVICDWHLTVRRNDATRHPHQKIQQMEFILERDGRAWKIFNLRVVSTYELT